MLSGLMEMDHGIGTEEHVAVGSCNNNSHVIKGKRTKRRLKSLSPCVFTTTSTAVTSSCSSASCGGGGGGSFSSTTFEGTTDQEEEDMAKCLILLAQGKREREEEEEGDRDRDPNHHHQHHQYKLQKAENHVSKSGLVENYECKTCNRTFPSFQALGGHRASHKKPKMQVEKKSSPPQPFPITAITGTATMAREFEEGNYDYKQGNMMMKNIITNAPPVSLELRCGGVNNNKPSKPNKHNKIHECSICGSEFTSGQALGGHMRRHRASTSSSNNNNNNVDAAVPTLSVFGDVNVRSRNVLKLDLNLPAPEDDFHDSTFQFPVTRETVVLSSAPALVGCHN